MLVNANMTQVTDHLQAIKYPSIPGRFSGGIEAWIIVNPPFMSPAPPSPAMNRPAISIADVCAAPQMAEPMLKIVKKPRKSFLELNRAYILPVRGWKEALVGMSEQSQHIVGIDLRG
jgi:hypothetical protein